MKMHNLRQRYLKTAKDMCVDSGYNVTVIDPASQGKKGLVFFVDTDRGNFVLRLYSNPFYYLKTSKILSRIYPSGIAVEIVRQAWHFQVRPLVFAFILEERLKPLQNIESEEAYDFFYRLGRLHGYNLLRNKSSFTLLWRKWLKKTKGSVGFIVEFMPEKQQLLKNVLSKLVDFAPSPVLSLCHRDIAPSNMGLKGSKLYLFDWDRASLFFPLYELSQALHFMRRFGETEKAVKFYLEGSGLEEGYVIKELRFFQAMFAISKVKKLIKRGKFKNRDIDYLLSRLENLTR
ncbi:hypothetical protein TST_1373 [Thermosulfidibacter takaii ABI70S6]|uniref:Aminoglycoside phosphotransferase domain-containing protein n=1 Tax=Thermosulfidibacter takaii (strain DSM 17441 / JCM 13301 / NBRC 103674 / ABI70S6) TaxID=1298851 RepID=A0A0S3QV11_THET7|nr:phosphotransferase [Thermosulfidibacter takaii]BAT72160.1 hypothetical protein TST_1373 [Thermosulfidibacter takaii ABI70S6]